MKFKIGDVFTSICGDGITKVTGTVTKLTDDHIYVRWEYDLLPDSNYSTDYTLSGFKGMIKQDESWVHYSVDRYHMDEDLFTI